jgi:hypothetical protein
MDPADEDAMNWWRTVLLLLVLPAPAAAQAATDIFVAELAVEDGRYRIGAPENVTRRAGYDNQPWFQRDGSGILYVSERGGQTDVFRYDLAARRTDRVTRTEWNEYSPSQPGGDDRLLVVRWPTDMSTGALWWYSATGEPLAEATGSVERVGYYAHADEHTLALFINDSIQSFILSDTRTGDTVRVGQQMGGSGPRRIPHAAAVSFLRQAADGDWWLMRLDVRTLEATPLVRMLEGVANYTWTDRGSVLAARGSTIYEWWPGGDWTAVAAFDESVVRRITRIAVSPGGDRIAFVAAAMLPDAP